MLKITFLGTGTSHGVPVIACRCPVCTSPDPRNQRMRCSILLEYGEARVLVDTPPELRLQAIRAGLTRLDAVLFTHSHADHVFGLDDVRRFNDLQGGALPCYANAETLGDLERIFRYVFVPTQRGGGKPRLELRPLDGRFDLFGLAVRPLTVMHGQLPITAYRLGNVAYVTDVSFLPEEAEDALHGLDLLILGALRFRPHSTHFSIPQALEVVARLRPRRALFTHLCHDVDHAAASADLPDGVGLAYDGLSVTVEV
ncbi:MAG: MBL fold metallo-hydrolase [Armatimonadetes bacterium]|nr:MBL fold metallo-hydrolase [Armatimonadota bacterium]